MQRVMPARVSPLVKQLGALAAIAIIAIVLVVIRMRASATPDRAETTPATPNSAPRTGDRTATHASPPRPRAVDHVVELSAANRAQVASQIADAQRARTSHYAAPTPAPSLPAAVPLDQDLDALKTTLRSAMHDVLPHLQACYERALPSLATPNFTIKAQLALTGDPDIGTLIDAKQLLDGDGVPLPAALDDCLRSSLQSLELPPLSEGSTIAVTYPFMFRSAPPD